MVELLVVITIMGILSVTSIVYYRSLTSDKMLLKAKDSIQSLLRTAQSNATSGFTCGTVQGASTWSVRITGNTTLELRCNPLSDPITVRTLALENDIQIDTVSTECSGPLQLNEEASLLNIYYSPLLGKVQFEGSDACLADLTRSHTLTVTLKNANSRTSFIISRGGAINAK